LHDAGAELFIADTNKANVKDVVGLLGATVIPVSEILDVDCDVFAPCALGHAVDGNAVERLKASIVCGAANNQLASDKVGYELHTKEILYAPDYVANAGGIINVASECLDWSKEDVKKRLTAIPQRMALVFERSKAEGRPPHLVADEMAEGLLKPAR
jgi:leucine dehydrogenase